MDTSIIRPGYCFNRKQQRESINGQHSLRVYNYAPVADLRELQIVISGALNDIVPSAMEA